MDLRPPQHAPVLFNTDAFREGLETLSDAAACGAADPSRMIATAERIRDGDPDSWLLEWTGLAGEEWAQGRFLNAASYYAAALALIADTDGSVSETALWTRQRDCWDRAVAALGGLPISIPYAYTTLPGYFFPAADARRPLVVIDHGGRHTTSHALALGGAAARARGFHWMTFDGPGRQATLVRQHLVLRPDWEAVLTAVVNAMAARPEVDASRMAIIGVEHAAYGVARALAFEHRFAAAVTAPGVVDVSTLWTDLLPVRARQALFAGDRATFNREIHLADLFDPRVNEVLRRRGRWYGLDGRDPYDLYSRVRRFRLGSEINDITTPLLVRENAPERLYPGQARDLFDQLPGPKWHTTRGDELDWIAERLEATGSTSVER
jgi:hypothetical protein